MPSLWYVFTDLARDKNKKWILEQWPKLSPELRYHYREALLQYLEKYGGELKKNLALTDSFAATIKKLFCKESERNTLLKRLEQVIIGDAERYPRAIAVRLMAQLLPADQRIIWNKKILQPGTFPDKLRIFLLGSLIKFWLEEGDEMVRNMFWEAFQKEKESTNMFKRLLELWGNYNGALPSGDYPTVVDRIAAGKEEVFMRHKLYALMIMARFLGEDIPERLREFFKLVEELPRKDWELMFKMIPANSTFQPIILEKIQSYAARKEGHIKRAALWLITNRHWDDNLFSGEIFRSLENITNTCNDEVLELVLKELLAKPSLIERLPTSFLHHLGLYCFKKSLLPLVALGLRLLAYGIARNRWHLINNEWSQIWQAIETQLNPFVSIHLWKLVQVAITNKDCNFPAAWSWSITGSFLDRWIENDHMQKPIQEAFIAVGEWGTIKPKTAVDLLLQYKNRQMKDNGRYKWIGAVLRIINSEGVSWESKQEIISQILALLKQSDPDEQILLTDVIVRIPEQILKQNESWKGFGFLLAEPSLCDRAKVILQDQVGRFLEIPPLPGTFFQNIRNNICY
jgi:hypothetical protein